MTISLRLSDIDAHLIKAFANYHNETTSHYIKRIVMDDIESEYMRVLEDFLEATDGPVEK